MLFTRFTQDARQVVARSHAEAARAGSGTIEAEHLLLALSAVDGPAAHALATAGADHETLTAALRDEREAALQAVGVSTADYDLPDPPTTPAARNLPFATSAKTALERTLRAAAAEKASRVEGTHVLLGVLAAEQGTVPRALRIAGVDRDAVRAGVERG
ncbi:Clp protease N-terminal domain-containing protein [Patulibacter sp. SYSU D01012]|uniref:Clp protease N-terminal domain-containing protein n=1 Tax=Patulibacter sp. SYSU D01012 TaxID=2817381 RepID=UPI001B30831E|nr:Clp protease N-terminal domain-containing protein [Patulibacter sp. SYSU D01012]